MAVLLAEQKRHPSDVTPASLEAKFPSAGGAALSVTTVLRQVRMRFVVGVHHGLVNFLYPTAPQNTAPYFVIGEL